MVTDNFYPRLYSKQILPMDLLKKHFFDQLVREAAAAGQNEYRTDGVFDALVTVEPSGVVDALDIAHSAGFRAVDGLGDTFLFGAADGRLDDVKFPNTVSTAFHWGLQVARMPGAPAAEPVIETNPQTRQPEYRLMKETIGRVGQPSSVVYNSGPGTLTFGLTGLFIGGNGNNPHTGRTAKVWLKVPKSTDEAVAFQSAVIQPPGSITTATGQTLGQGTTPSTNPADYLVIIEGPSVCRSADRDLRTPPTGTGTVAVTGTAVTGSGTAFTTQLAHGDTFILPNHPPRNVLSITDNTHMTLDEAYDADVAAGAGFTVAGAFFLAAVTGSGVATLVPSGNISTADQNVIEFSGSDFDEILRRCAHGKVKIRVTPDGSDTDEPQIEITDRWKVDETGKETATAANTETWNCIKELQATSGQMTQAIFVQSSAAGIGFNLRWDKATNKWKRNYEHPSVGASLQVFGPNGWMLKYKGPATSWTDDEWDRTIPIGPGAAVGFNIAGVGTISSTGPQITGVGTRFLAQCRPGQALEVSGAIPAVVFSIADDLHCTVVQAPDPAWSGASFYVRNYSLNDFGDGYLAMSSPLFSGAGGAGYQLCGSFLTGLYDRWNVYVTDTVQTDLAACMVLNAVWNPEDGTWQTLDQTKMAWRIWFSTISYGACRIEYKAVTTGTWIDNQWSGALDVTLGASNQVLNLFGTAIELNSTGQIIGSDHGYKTLKSVDRKIGAGNYQTQHNSSGVPDWVWNASAQRWTSRILNGALLTIPLAPETPSNGTIKRFRVYVDIVADGEARAQLKKKNIVSGAVDPIDTWAYVVQSTAGFHVIDSDTLDPDPTPYAPGTDEILFIEVWDSSIPTKWAGYVHDCRVEFETTDVLQR
jgi:hypothetical protein